MADYEKYVSANHIAPADQWRRFEPQRVYNFTLLLTPPHGVEMDWKDADVIALSLREFPMPNESTDRIELPYGNEVRYVAGKTTFSTETLRCVDYIDRDTAGVLHKWRRRVYNPDEDHVDGIPQGGVGWAHQYKSDGEIIWLNPDGSALRDRWWNLIGIWPMSIRYGSGNMASSDVNIIEVEFSVDRIEAGS